MTFRQFYFVVFYYISKNDKTRENKTGENESVVKKKNNNKKVKCSCYKGGKPKSPRRVQIPVDFLRSIPESPFLHLYVK